MERAELIRLVNAHDWVWSKWWPSLVELSSEEAYREVGGSFPTVFTTTAHMVAAEMAWQNRCEGDTASGLPHVAQSIPDLKTDWEELAARRLNWLEAANLDSPISYNFTGGSATNRIDEIILHVTSHAHFHRGQLASQFRLLGLKPPSSHLIGFFRL